MPKTCKLCPYPVFSGGYCLRHYSHSSKGRAAILESQQKRRVLKPYKQRSAKGGGTHGKGLEDSTSGPKPAKTGKFWTAVEVADTWFSRYVRLLYAVPGSG